MDREIEVGDVPSRPTVAIRAKCAPAQIAAEYDRILPTVWGYLESKGVHPAAPPFGRFFEYTADVADFEAGLPVPATFDLEDGAPDGIAASELPGGTVAVTWHIGPYDTLGATHRAMEAWIEGTEHETAGAPWEVYWTDPRSDPDSARWRTEVVYPIR